MWYDGLRIGSSVDRKEFQTLVSLLKETRSNLSTEESDYDARFLLR